jgi:uncharacterized membrane protein (Fun14 family)
MKSVSRGTLLRRRSTRHISEITAIASEFGNSAKIIVPRSWLRRRVIAFLHFIPFAGSGLLGYAMGFALKKILKWMLIIVGLLAGMFFVGIQLLQKYGYVSTVNWDRSYLVNVSANYKNTFKHLFPYTGLSSDVVNKLECLCISLEIVFVDAHELCHP